MYGYINIFYEYSSFDYFKKIEEKLKNEIYGEPEKYILEVNEEEYIDHLYQKYCISNVIIDFDNAEAKPYEKEVMLTDGFDPHRKYPAKRMAYTFYIPYNCEDELLEIRPSTYLLWSMKVKLYNNYITFELVDLNDKIDNINKEYERIKQNLTTMSENLNKDINQFNSSLLTKIRNLFQKRKSELKHRYEQMQKLVVPIRKSENTPEVFSVTPPKIRKKIVPKPVVENEKFSKPEPTLDDKTYKEILQAIYQIGMQFERTPSVYKDKEEEHLRDHFLLILEPNFEGAATGETFNNTGKTDILLRYEGSNIFVAECKFWKGKKQFLKTIDQLLGYLTWRDSKAAVIMFVREKGFTEIVKKANEAVKEHSNFVRFVKQETETWSNYIFHLNGDKDREIKVAVMLFHIPDVD
ncbi:hypothetical protein [Parageobacillus sp. G301]|uniref:hypothetical protein n=1 Tax=Parageobacillus sp. G301 TaxID=2998290 RepID=UPI002496B9B9|nr:hypothetical protein [Parageobacillus sp. G301]GLH62408.1 hypothetical protein PG301_02480 [Parageobacillus sp. G301]